MIDLEDNAWEWCEDWHDVEAYRNSLTKNPIGPESGEQRLLRGGAFDSAADYARCVSRDFIVPETGYATVVSRFVMFVEKYN